jgi:protein gp37
MGMKKYRNGFKLTLHPNEIMAPYKWKKSKIVFVNSMSDLFHPDVPLTFIQRVFNVMNETPQHIYQVLTKRSDRLKELAPYLNWTHNIWMGVSVENSNVDDRILDLSETPAFIKFLSVEPLIGPLDNLYLKTGINWVIVGGESGHGARPIKKEWIMKIYRDCKEHHVPFFFKQWGKTKFNTNQNDPTIKPNHPKHAKGGCQLNGRVYRQMPKFVH